MIRMQTSGSFQNTNKFLQAMATFAPTHILERYAKMGVEALRTATPVASGITAESWDYEVVVSGGRYEIWWTNTNVVNGFNVAIGLRYGHGTRNGGYVQGQNYITPALKPVFDKIADAVWEEVRKA